MARSSGDKDTWPTKGKPPTGMFSSKGSQKMDSTAGVKHMDMTGNKLDGPRVKPVKRDNRIK